MIQILLLTFSLLLYIVPSFLISAFINHFLISTLSSIKLFFLPKNLVIPTLSHLFIYTHTHTHTHHSSFLPFPLILIWYRKKFVQMQETKKREKYRSMQFIWANQAKHMFNEKRHAPGGNHPSSPFPRFPPPPPPWILDGGLLRRHANQLQNFWNFLFQFLKRARFSPSFFLSVCPSVCVFLSFLLSRI